MTEVKLGRGISSAKFDFLALRREFLMRRIKVIGSLLIALIVAVIEVFLLRGRYPMSTVVLAVFFSFALGSGIGMAGMLGSYLRVTGFSPARFISLSIFGILWALITVAGLFLLLDTKEERFKLHILGMIGGLAAIFPVVLHFHRKLKCDKKHDDKRVH